MICQTENNKPNTPKMITKKFGIDFHSEGGALTLSPSDIGRNDSGWTIIGVIHEDYYEWVNDFQATHPKFGKVWGNFEKEVYAESEEGFAHFWENHEPQQWDYQDI